MVNAGTTITYIIPTNNKWVIANYKETQIENLYVGQKVRMTVDAISNKEFEGKHGDHHFWCYRFEIFAGTYRQFCWQLCQIQQRVPVRIDFNNLSKGIMSILLPA